MLDENISVQRCVNELFCRCIANSIHIHCKRGEVTLETRIYYFSLRGGAADILRRRIARNGAWISTFLFLVQLPTTNQLPGEPASLCVHNELGE